MKYHLSGRSSVWNRNGLFIAPNEFGTPQMSVLHTRSCCSTLDTGIGIYENWKWNGNAGQMVFVMANLVRGRAALALPEEWCCHIHQKALDSFPLLAWQACFYGFFLSLLHFCTWQITTTCVYTSSISFSAEETTEKSREHSHRSGYCQRNNNGMFSLVSKKVMVQLPSANKKKQYEIRNVLGTSSFGKKSWYV